MSTVFIGGSRRISAVNADIARRLDNIMQKGLKVVVGDANGFDRAAQAYLAEHGYRNILIYCTRGECRNNIGGWRAFYTAKDDAMLQDADFGLFAWEGTSRGTLRNIQRMTEMGKPSAVYVSVRGKFLTVRNPADALKLSGETALHAGGTEELFSDAWQRSNSSPAAR